MNDKKKIIMKTKQLMNLALISGLLLTAGCGDDQNTGNC